MRALLSLAVAVTVVISAALPTNGREFLPISSVTATTSADDLWPVTNLISGAGVGFDADEPHDQIIVGGPESLWVTNAFGFPTDYIELKGAPVLTFDMGGDVLLGEIAVWGYSATNSNGMNEFSLKFATSEEGLGGFGSSIAYNPTFSEGITNEDNISMVPFVFGEKVTARFVELTATDNFFIAPGDGGGGEIPGGDRVGLGEVAFPVPAIDLTIDGGGETYFQDFDSMSTANLTPAGWTGVDNDGSSRRIAGLGLTDGFLTVPGSDDDGVLGLLNLGGNAERFGPAPDGFVPTWTAELGGDNNLFGRDDALADNASDRALGVSRENNDDVGELNFEIKIVDNAMRAFVLDWDLEIWGGDPDTTFRAADGAGMKTEVTVGETYGTMTENLLPGALFDSTEDGTSDHNATLIDGNVHSIRGITSGIQEVADADGAVGNMVQINFNSNWNGATGDGANGWFSAVDNVRLRALAPGDADANGVVDVADLLQLLGAQKFNQGIDGVTWEQGDFNADDQFNTGDLLAMLSFLSGTFPSDPYASEAGGASDAVADIIVNSETGEVTVDLAGHTVSAVIIESASEIFNGQQPEWDTTSQFPSTLPGELGNVLFTSTTSGVDELGAVISAEFLGRDKEFYLQDLDLNILIASAGGALTKGNVIVVPEPSTWMLLGLGSLLLVGWRQGATRRSPGMN